MQTPTHEVALALAAPEMLIALKLAQKALLFSEPKDKLDSSFLKHHEAHNAVCSILVQLKEL